MRDAAFFHSLQDASEGVREPQTLARTENLVLEHYIGPGPALDPRHFRGVRQIRVAGQGPRDRG